MLVIGSTALSKYGKLPNGRKQRDIDIIARHNDIKTWFDAHYDYISCMHRKENPWRYHAKMIYGGVFELVVVDGTSGQRLLALPNNKTAQFGYGHDVYPIAHDVYPIASLRVQRIIKRSHLFVARNWEKHMADYHYIRQMDKSALSDEENEILQARVAETQEREGERPINLEMANDDFFNHSEGVVQRVFEHDDLHRATCFYNTPLFERFKTDGDNAAISQELFEQADYVNRLRLVQEEAYAIALERFIIPPALEGEIPNHLQAYQKAIKLICTTLTRGWFRDFAIENWPTLWNNIGQEFGKKLKEKLLSGEVNPKKNLDPVGLAELIC